MDINKLTKIKIFNYKKDPIHYKKIIREFRLLIWSKF